MRFLQHPVTELIFRYSLAAVFLAACFHKIPNPDSFAKVIYNYKILPAALINPLAIILPYVELVCGLALLAGFYPRGATLLACLMLLVFIAAISFNLARGMDFDCGCFAVKKAGESADPKWVLARDILYLALGAWVFLYKKTRKFCIKSF